MNRQISTIFFNAMQERLKKAQAVFALIDNGELSSLSDHRQANLLWCISTQIDEAMDMSRMVHTRYCEARTKVRKQKAA